MAEVTELFEGWDEHPPTNILVKALLKGLGGKPKGELAEATGGPLLDIPPEAAAAMQRSVLSQIQQKAGNRIPIIQGRDRGLPKTPPVFDVEILREKNLKVAQGFRKVGDVGVRQ